MSATGKAHTLGAILATANCWTVITADASQLASIIVLIEATLGNLMIGINPTGVHGVQPLDPMISINEVSRRLVSELDASSYSKPILVRLRRERLDQPQTTATIQLGPQTANLSDTTSIETGSLSQLWPKVVTRLG